MTVIEVINSARALLNESLDAARVFPDNSSSYYTDTQMLNYLNLIQDEVQNEIIQTFEDYFVTAAWLDISASVQEYSLPTNCIKVRRVEDARNDNPVEIFPVTINNRISDRYYELASGTTFNGNYYLRGQQIVFTEKPSFTSSAAIRVFYAKKLAALTSATDSSEIPSEYHSILTWGVVKYCLFQEQAETSRAEAEYNKRLVLMKQQAENRQVQRPRKVRSVYGDD